MRLHHVFRPLALTCAAVLALQVACSNVGGSPTTDPTGTNTSAKTSTAPTAPVLTIDTSSYQLVSSNRTGRTTFTYTYTVKVINSSSVPAANVTATVSSSAAATVIASGSVSFGNVAANGSATSINTFTIEQNRTVAFNPAALQWLVQGTTNAYMPGTAALPGVPAQAYSTTVQLPVGSTLVPNQTTVVTSVDQQIPTPGGQITIQGYSIAGGSQLVAVLSPNGNAMLLGWLDANHASVSASTTAEVLAYFSLGGHFMLSSVDTASLIRDIPGAPGFETLVQAIASSVAANPDALGAANPTIQSALNAFVGPLLPTPANTISTGSKAAAVHARAAHGSTAAAADITRLVTKALSGAASTRATLKPVQRSTTVGVGAQSGITVNTFSPSSFTLTNTTRRRAHAFVEEVSTTSQGVKTPEDPPVAITDFDVAPEGGVSGGVVGALADVLTAVTTAYYADPGQTLGSAYDNAGTAYTPQDSPSSAIALPLDSGTTETDYNVTVVGCGVGNQALIQALPQTQSNQRLITCVSSLVTDLLAPFIANFVGGSGVLDNVKGNSPGLNTLAKIVGDNLIQDLLNYYQNLQAPPNIVYSALQGDWETAYELFLTAAVTSNSFVNAGLKNALLAAVKELAPAEGVAATTAAVQNITKVMTNVLNWAGAGGQLFDTSVMLTDIANADGADVFPIAVTQDTVKLNPIGQVAYWGGESVKYTASIVGATDLTGYTFLWSWDGTAGNINVSGTAQTATSICSNSPVATYVTSALAPSGQPTVDDAISVTAYYGAGSNICSPKVQVGSSGEINLTVKENSDISIAPETTTATPGTQITFQASEQGVVTAGDIPPPSPAVTWVWTLTGNGSIGASPVTTKVPQISYTAGSAGTDSLTVVAYDADNNSLGNATATIAVSGGTGLTFTASSGSACCGGVAPGTYTTPAPGVGSYTGFFDNNNNLVYGLAVVWNFTVPYTPGAFYIPAGPWQPLLGLALAPNQTISAPGTWTSRPGILSAVNPGQFIFICASCDNQGSVVITKIQPQSDGTLLATFTFTESSGSPSSTRTYQGNGQFTIPAP
jgi:hypothetical protein